VEHILSVDWAKTFLPSTPLLEILVRGSLTYLILFALLRVVLRREKGDTSVTDLLVVVLIADAAQNAMADNYTSLTDGIVLVGIIIWRSFFLNWLDAGAPAATAAQSGSARPNQGRSPAAAQHAQGSADRG
jgi:uncharacterized membrane protein YcaP (DUF421 family)